MTGTARVIRADSRNLPLADDSVDLVVTSPPYFALRSYTDNGVHYERQIGAEATPDEFVTSLLEVTAECVRVLKPTGSLWVNLGDSYAGSDASPGGASKLQGGKKQRAVQGNRRGARPRRSTEQMTREDAAWLAGVIDSDGSVSIHVNKQPEGRAPSFVAWLRVGQMRPEVVTRIAELTGIGQVMCDGRGVYSWGASAQQARWVLERIHPWLLIKKRQSWAAIEVARHVEARNAKGAWRALTTADIAYRQRLRDAVLAWNAGEADDLEPPAPGTVYLPHSAYDPRAKSLRGLPWRYALRCIDDLGLILRAEVIWSKPNGLPESVTDRVRRSHEQWFHFTLSPRYFSAVDEIREAHLTMVPGQKSTGGTGYETHMTGHMNGAAHALGKFPGSVWTIPTEPLRVPDHLGVDHFAAFPTEWPRRIIAGWSPAGVCVACGEGRRPVSGTDCIECGGFRPANSPRCPECGHAREWREGRKVAAVKGQTDFTTSGAGVPMRSRSEMTHAKQYANGYACACPEPTADTTPAVVLDPFGGTGTTALVAKTLGRHGITVDMSADYCRLAEWRVNDPDSIAHAMRVDKPAKQVDGQESLLDLFDGGAA